MAVTPLFARPEVGAPMELVGHELPERLEEECNRVLRAKGLEITQSSRAPRSAGEPARQPCSAPPRSGPG